ncbi:MAG: hypothetical protein QM747_16690 [Nocardioides sp.]
MTDRWPGWGTTTASAEDRRRRRSSPAENRMLRATGTAPGARPAAAGGVRGAGCGRCASAAELTHQAARAAAVEEADRIRTALLTACQPRPAHARSPGRRPRHVAAQRPGRVDRRSDEAELLATAEESAGPAHAA